MKFSRNIFLKALQRACLCGVILIGCLFIHHSASADDVWTEPVTGMEFVKIPGGCFQMGSPASEQERDLDEGPVHQVCVDSFWLGKYEVTNAQYRQWQPKHDSREYHGHSLNGETQPVGYVRWNDASAFAEWLTEQHENTPHPTLKGGNYTFRLPTEAEWEYAARAGTTTSRYWGDDPDDACQYANVHDQTSKRVNEEFVWPHHACDDGYAVTAPVGSFRPNAFGLYDMLGNVWEWCQDNYTRDAYHNHARHNPLVTSRRTRRHVRRGDNWYSEPKKVRSADRYYYAPGCNDFDFVGFRLVRTP